jgi:redox-sensitive bicupin YhaK (pirin superfamily)
MITVYPYANLGHADHGWLDARHHFSFARYHNPQRTRFGALHVINDDMIAAGRGFALHPHDNMEIITYVREGAISHADNQGNAGRTGAGDVQVMSAGRGVSHSEHNRESVTTHIYQIWIEPNARDVAPRWEAKAFPKEFVENALHVLVSGRSEDASTGALFIHQDAAIYGGNLKSGTSISQSIKHQAYILASKGTFTINDQPMNQGDGAEVVGLPSVDIVAQTDAEILIIDVPDKAA